MRIIALTTVADDSRTMLSRGLAIARTIDRSVISALPLTFYRKAVSLPTPGPCRAWNALKKHILSICYWMDYSRGFRLFCRDELHAELLGALG